MNNVYEICFYTGLILAIIFLIVSLILFIVLKIPKVISELSGRAAKKAIKDRQQGKVSEGSVSKKKEQAKYYNQNSGKIKARDTVSQETRTNNQDDTTDSLGKNNGSEKKPAFTPQFDPEETAVLGANPKLDAEIARASSDTTEAPTDILSDEDEKATDVLRTEEVDEEATDVLKAEDADEDIEDAPTDVLKTEDVAEELDDAPTDVLKAETEDDEDEAPTDILRAEADDEPATDILRGPDVEPEEADSTTVLTSKKTIQLANKVKVIYNIVVVQTDEKV